MAFNQQYKSGKINANELDLSKIYSSLANAQSSINNIKITEKNTSWKSDDLTYQIKEGGAVLICNHGIPIGYTNLEALDNSPEVSETNTEINEPEVNVVNATDKGAPSSYDGEQGSILHSNAEDDLQSDSVEEVSEIPNIENVDSDTIIEKEYVEEANEELEEPVDETTSGETSIGDEYDNSRSIEVEEVEEIPEVEETDTTIEETVPDPPIDIESIEETPEVQQEETVIESPTYVEGSEINASNLSSYANDYDIMLNKIRGNTSLLDYMINFFRSKGLTDSQVAGIIGNSAMESELLLDAQNPTSSAHGLFQWLQNRYPSSWDVDTQLNHAWDEILTRTDRSGLSVLEHLSTTGTANDACDSYRIYFEGGNTSSNARTYARGVLYYMQNK